MQILFQWYQLDLNCRTDLLEELKIETVLSIAVKSFVNKRPIMLDRVFKNGPSKLCGRQPLKNFTWPILEYFVLITVCFTNIKRLVAFIWLSYFIVTLCCYRCIEKWWLQWVNITVSVDCFLIVFLYIICFSLLFPEKIYLFLAIPVYIFPYLKVKVLQYNVKPFDIQNCGIKNTIMFTVTSL